MAIKFFAFFFRQSVLSDVFGLNGRHHWQLRAAAQRCGAGGCRREATWILEIQYSSKWSNIQNTSKYQATCIHLRETWKKLNAISPTNCLDLNPEKDCGGPKITTAPTRSPGRGRPSKPFQLAENRHGPCCTSPQHVPLPSPVCPSPGPRSFKNNREDEERPLEFHGTVASVGTQPRTQIELSGAHTSNSPTHTD